MFKCFYSRFRRTGHSNGALGTSNTGSENSNTSSTEIDDEAQIPRRGFLSGKNHALPTYRKVTNNPWGLTSTGPTLNVIDIVETIESNYTKARLILYETARLNRPRFAMIQHGRIKLDDKARTLDQALYEATEEVVAASTVEDPQYSIVEVGRPGESDDHDRTVRNPDFKNALGKYTMQSYLWTAG